MADGPEQPVERVFGVDLVPLGDGWRYEVLRDGDVIASGRRPTAKWAARAGRRRLERIRRRR
jgi:hypothetical protein